MYQYYILSFTLGPGALACVKLSDTMMMIIITIIFLHVAYQ